MTAWTLRVMWPIVDAAMYEAEAIYEAWSELPRFAEVRQVTFADSPKMRVVQLTPEQQVKFGASRAVVCEAPVIRRATTPLPRPRSRRPQHRSEPLCPTPSS